MTALKLFLFDLDGTLVSTGGAGLRALTKAFRELYDIENAHERVNPAGKTDPAIFREILRVAAGKEASSGDIQTISRCYLSHLEVEMKTARTQTLKGVRSFVEKAASHEGVVVGLGTGNLERGARLKLEPANLNSYFSFGGFGSDAEDRAEVLRCGHRRAEEKTKQVISKENVFIIGDTLLDVGAAKRAGFKSVAVATGHVSLETLRSGDPDFLLPDLSEGGDFFE